jgi:transmembrane sensor
MEEAAPIGSRLSPAATSRDALAPREALARYLAGESSADEAEGVRRWLAERPASAELVAALDRAMARVAFTPPADLDVEGALRRVHASFDEASVKSLPARATTVARRRMFGPPAGSWRGTAWRVAAVLAVIAGGSLLWSVVRTGGRVGTGSAARVFATAVGTRDSTRLPDGSRVVLGPGSELTIRAGYGETQREVALRGEAYFDVVHDERRPFVVRAGDAVIRDVGTSFAVHSDGGDGVRVVVTAGAVRLSLATAPNDSGVVLGPQDRASVEPEGRVVVERTSATPDDLAWRQGRLVFRDAPLAKVRADIRRWYGIELQLADSSLASKHVSNPFTAGDSREQVLRVLSLSLGATGELRGDTIVLRAAPRPGTMRR